MANPPADPSPSAFDELLDLRFRGVRVDGDAFLASHPELSDGEREQVRRLCRGSGKDAGSSEAVPPANGESPRRPVLSGDEPPIPRLGSFRLERRIGAGGMGAVFLATDESLGRHVAVKVLGPDLLGTGERAERFLREARAVARLRHPNVVHVYSAGEEGGFRYMAMELVPGASLQDLIGQASVRGRRLPVADVVRWGAEIAAALQAAHDAGIIHRDVKPSNIRITPDGKAVLLDFGLVLDDGATTLTESGAFRGSPQYASPEQVGVAGVAIDARTDVYSLGATLYEAWTGTAPHRGETRQQVFHQILNREPVPPRRLDPTLPRDLENVVLTALDKEPRRRYATAGAFAADLAALREGRPVSARPVSAIGRLVRWARRQPVKAALAATAVAALLTAAVLGGFIASNLDGIARAAAAEKAARLASILEQAFLEYGEGDPENAQGLFEQALRLDAGSAEARAGFALCRIGRGDSGGAIAFLESADGRKDEGSWKDRIVAQAKVAIAAASGQKTTGPTLKPPASALEHFLAGMQEIQGACRGDAKRADRAFDELRLAVQGSPRATPLFFHELGHAAWHARRDKEAREVAADIARLWPPSPESSFAIGRALMDADHSAALDALENAAAAPPRSLTAREFIAIRLALSGRQKAVELALGLARETVRAAPARAKSQYALGIALDASGDAPGAIQALEEAIRLRQDVTGAHRNLARILIGQNAFARALPYAREAVRQFPRGAAEWNILGAALRELQEIAEARRCFETALDLEPEDHHALCNLGRVLLLEGEFARGAELLRKGHEKASTDPKWQYPSKKWLENADRLVALEARFEEWRRGEGKAPSLDERMFFAYEICRPKKLSAAAVKLFDESFKIRPDLARQQGQRHRAGATEAALTAGTGAAADAPADDAGRKVLRDRALSWFSEEIGEWEEIVESTPSRAAVVGKWLDQWLKRKILAGTRPPARIDGVSESEAADWARLWERFERVRAAAGGTPETRLSR